MTPCGRFMSRGRAEQLARQFVAATYGQEIRPITLAEAQAGGFASVEAALEAFVGRVRDLYLSGELTDPDLDDI